MCWEHMVPLTSAAMSAMNEQVHVASWPTIAYHRGGAFEAIREFKVRSGLPDQAPDISAPEIMTRHYALATQTFVIMSTSMLNGEAAGRDGSVRSDRAISRRAGCIADHLAPDRGVINIRGLPATRRG